MNMHNNTQQKILHFIGLVILLFSVWVLLSGKFEFKFLSIGLVSSIIVAIICHPFLTVKNAETGKTFLIFNINPIKALVYCIWLLKEIFKSAIDVMKDIFEFKVEREPRIVYFSMPYENPIASVVLANSIILTPGTITIDVHKNGIYEVHALNESFAEGLLTGEMQLKVAHLFNEKCNFTPMEQLTYVRKGIK